MKNGAFTRTNGHNMDNTFVPTDEMLWDYVDGLLDNAEKLRLESFLAQHPGQRTRLEAIQAEKRAFSALMPETPDAGFAAGVLQAWAAQQTAAPVVQPLKNRDWIVKLVAISLGVMVLAPIIVMLVMMPSTAGSISVPETWVQQIEPPAFDWGGFFANPLLRLVLLAALAMMGLKVLDKYLQVKHLQLA